MAARTKAEPAEQAEEQAEEQGPVDGTKAEPAEPTGARIEVFEAVRPDGEVVVVTRNIDTGQQDVAPKEAE